MENDRKYLVNHNRRDFHLSDSSETVCVPAPTDVVGFSDSMDSLVYQGFLPCRFCLSEVDIDTIREIQDDPIVHHTFKVG